MKKYLFLLAVAALTLGTSCKKTTTTTPTPTPTPVNPSPTPSVVTSPVVFISDTAAYSGGTVTYGGTAAMIAVGVCWDTSPNPTTLKNLTNNGAGTGDFGSHLTNLQIGTKYYVRAYATNLNGTSYGNEVSFNTPAGWIETKQPEAVNISALIADGPYLMEAQTGNFLLSSDSGATWSKVQNSDLANINCLMSYNGYIYASTEDKGIYRSNDHGSSWTNVYTVPGIAMRSLAVLGNRLYVSSSTTVYWTQNGTTWQAIQNSVGSQLDESYIKALYSNGSYLYAISDNMYVYKRMSNQTIWQPDFSPSCSSCTYNDAINFNTTLLVGSTGETIQNVNATWSTAGGFPSNISAFASQGSGLLIATGDGKFQLSDNGGVNWQPLSRAGFRTGYYARHLLIYGSYYIATGSEGAIYRKKR